ncbi:MAG: ferrous iron transporter B [Clostridia bacterium]|nr:ferrous iron transporter B [Clostridia bacterium]
MENEKNLRIALAGNPNCGKTTLFNALTGSNQFVGNWPGVTVEKKEGKLKKQDDVTIVDLPGIYSLSPYTLEEVVARNYLIGERPDAILNIVDATNLERNLYLTTQLTELGIPVVIALNMMDVVKKNGDKINVDELSRKLGCKIIEISALKGTGIMAAAEAAVSAARSGKTIPTHSFSGPVEHAIAHIEEAAVHNLPEERQRWYAIKIFERDSKAIESLNIPKDTLAHIENDIVAAEKELDDDAESIITNERYVFIAEVLKGCYKKHKAGQLSVSDKIDRVVTNRWLALPIFLAIMFVVYFISVTTVGTLVTDWTNDGLFGDGWHLFGIGAGEYEEKAEEFGDAQTIVEGYLAFAEENGMDVDDVNQALEATAEEYEEESEAEEAVKAATTALNTFYEKIKDDATYKTATFEVTDDETMVTEETEASVEDLEDAIKIYAETYEFAEPDPASYGVWVPGIPALVSSGLEAIGCWDWLEGLIVDGIIAGVGAVLGFVPQIFVLFIFLAFLESCGYMARIAFVLDRIFRKFGLSGKSFIPMLIGSGCGIPGIMASRTIENERDRRMTIMTTTFIPCGAKLPFIAMIAGVIFKNAWWVSPLAYIVGVAAVIVSGIILKKTKMFAGDPSPFVIELPAYHLPTVGNILRSMWERGWSFIKKAGTIILLSTIVVWFLSFFGWGENGFGMLGEEEIGNSILAYICKPLSYLFAPLGFGTWQATAASITGIVAKENIVGTMGILYGESAAIGAAFTAVSGLSFLFFNLLCAPCFAAIGAIKREMNNRKWTWFAIGYQTGFAYVVAYVINWLGRLFTGNLFSGVNPFVGVLALIIALALIGGIVYLLVRPYKEATTFDKEVKVK